MVEVFGVGMAVYFSPKDLGLDAGISVTIFGQLGLDIWTVFRQFGAEFFGMFWAVPRLIHGLLLAHVCCLCVITKMNNMLVV